MTRSSSRSPRLRLAALAAMASLAGCAGRHAAVIGPVPDASASAHSLETDTRPEAPLRIVFGWQLNEGGVRVGGRGVARVEPPYKARLDLFRNGETVAKAALVDGELRLPPGALDEVLPPADLMWGVLGVFRPVPGTELVGGDRLEDGGVRLRYRYGDGTELHYWARDGRVRVVERVQEGTVVERVQLDIDGAGRYPTDALYRNLAEYRELRLVRESLEESEGYPPSIWYPAGNRIGAREQAR